ncbi:MAG: bifunctional UDP-N-acetylmuramoyl-tripeptide:D-alanyl-D-alanine ligase/alanine racemase [Ferruginibacter sp.]
MRINKKIPDMHAIRFSDISAILQTKPLRQFDDPFIENLLTDSRKLLLPENTLFFAISSPQKDAHIYLDELYAKGVRAFIAGPTLDDQTTERWPEANIICVQDPLKALQELAAYHRHRFSYPVVGITGSNGKTMVKEWLYQLLGGRYHIVRSPKSYNSQVGVPLSVWAMSSTHNLAIFEAGISQPGEMNRLRNIIDPDIGIITFMGEAHAEGFLSFDEKLAEKLSLFTRSRMLICCIDDPRVATAVARFCEETNPGLQLFSWGHGADAVLQLMQVDRKGDSSIIHFRYRGEGQEFMIPFADEASVFNAMTCCCLMLALDISMAPIALGMTELKPVEMRLELKQGINRCSIINDSYSADINSLSIALDFLAQQHQHNRHTVILSDFLQTGIPDDALYATIARILQRRKLHRLIGIGPAISRHAALFTPNFQSAFFESTTDFLQQAHSLSFQDEAVLLKGARVFQFEKISRLLEQKIHETVLEINLNALRNNLKIYRNLLKDQVKLMVMVKAFSYGSGSFEIASLLQHAGVDYLAVAYADEGVELRKAGIRLPIMVMNTSEAGYDNMVQYRLEPELYSFQSLDAFRYYLEQKHITQYPVHLKFDTGMHRLGFMENELDILCEKLSQPHPFVIRSVFSHLVASENPVHDAFTRSQSDAFLRICRQLSTVITEPFLKHIANTSAIHRHPDYQFDMVRLGIGLYGVDDRQPLENVTTLRTTVSQVKQVPAGESVGYSRRAVMDRDSSIATVRIGYADGYSRVLGNGIGKMLVNGQLAPVVGNVCMDMTMLDVTGIPVSEGDEVIVFGHDLPVTTLAGWAGTIPYEILTNVSQRVKRVYFEE